MRGGSGAGPIFRKEWREIARDKRVTVGAFVMPMVLVLFLVQLMGGLDDSVERAQRNVALALVAAEDGNPVADALAQAEALQIQRFADEAGARRALEDGDVAAVLTFGPDFAARLARGGAETTILYDSRNPRSGIGMAVAREVIAGLNQASVRANLTAAGLSPDLAQPVRTEARDVAESTGPAGMGLVGMLPYLLVMWAFYGGLGAAADLVAGEKERGTLETLLTAAVGRGAVVAGKFAALALVCLLSSLSSVAGIALAGVAGLPGTEDLGGLAAAAGPVGGIGAAAALATLAAWFAAALLAVSAWARTMREAQTHLAVAGFIVIMPAVFSQVIGFTEMGSDPRILWVPILNTALVIRDALLGQAQAGAAAIAVGVNLALAAVSYAVVVRLFARETILRRS